MKLSQSSTRSIEEKRKEHVVMQTERRTRWLKKRYLAILGGSIVLLVAITLVVSKVSATFPPAARGINCGKLVIPFDIKMYHDNGAMRSAGNCFWNAYQHCATATLFITQTGMDDGVRSVFMLEQHQGSCVLTDTMQGYNANFNRRNPYQTTTCSPLTRDGNRLNFNGCGNGVFVSLLL